MATRKKLGNIPGCTEWQDLDSIGAVRRFVKWTILSMRNGTLCRADAATFAMLANVMARVLEGDSIEQRLQTLEKSAELRTKIGLP